MSYIGKTYSVPFNKGGLTHNPNVDMINPTDMIPPSRNIDLDENGRRKRGGTARRQNSDYDAAISGTPQIMGIYHFRMVDGTDNIVVAANDGYLYSAHDTEIIDGANTMSTTNYFDFEVFADELYIVDGATTPQKWTGSGDAALLTDIPADWATGCPQWIVKHGRGNSERLWCGGSGDNPNTIYISVNGDGDDFSDANVTTLNIETGDGFGIIGAVEFGDRLICFGKRQAYIIDDLDVDTSNWGYDQTQWKGGACNFRCIVRIPNDVICFTEDGEIYSVIAAETYGDYKAASLIRSSYMHRWIREFVDLAYFNDFHGVFDPYQRCVRFFVRRSGQASYNDYCLKYYIDRPLNEAWIVDDNPDYVNGYRASASALVRESDGVWKIYTGDYVGDIWRLNEANRNDNGEAYYGGFRLPNLPFDNPRIGKHYKRGWLLTQPEGNWNVNVGWWVDGTQQTTRTVSLVGTGGLLDSFTLGTDVLGGEALIDTAFALGQFGKRIQYEIYNTTVNQDFYCSQLLTDYKETGAKPD